MFATQKKISFESYKDYLASEHWQNVRKEAWKKLEHNCVICTDTGYLNLHHRGYDNLGCEVIGEDVCYLCKICHESVHFLDDGTKIALTFDALYKREEELRRERGNLFYHIRHAQLGDVVNRAVNYMGRF